MSLISTLPFAIPALATVIVAWLNRRKIIEVHTLVNGDRHERTVELARVNDELDRVKAELAELRRVMT